MKMIRINPLKQCLAYSILYRRISFIVSFIALANSHQPGLQAPSQVLYIHCAL